MLYYYSSHITFSSNCHWVLLILLTKKIKLNKKLFVFLNTSPRLINKILRSRKEDNREGKLQFFWWFRPRFPNSFLKKVSVKFWKQNLELQNLLFAHLSPHVDFVCVSENSWMRSSSGQLTNRCPLKCSDKSWQANDTFKSANTKLPIWVAAKSKQFSV